MTIMAFIVGLILLLCGAVERHNGTLLAGIALVGMAMWLA